MVSELSDQKEIKAGGLQGLEMKGSEMNVENPGKGNKRGSQRLRRLYEGFSSTSHLSDTTLLPKTKGRGLLKILL